ncbi:MAG TPA: hypothetical protein VLE73_04355 [Candidatus Saccharimonadales bacterium]|nr:hypothetical protein [Candidatus Saccharimonadales bacterium]
MGLQSPVYLVQGGAIDIDRGQLNLLGLEQMTRAGDWLRAQGLGERALVMSGTERYKQESAAMICVELGATVLAAPSLDTASAYPDSIVDLDFTLTRAVHETGSDPSDYHGIVVIAGRPLMDAARLFVPHVSNIKPTDRTTGGSIVQYVPETWPAIRRAANLMPAA